MLAPVYISTSTVRVLIVLHTRQHFIVFLNFSHAGERVEELHCGLTCISLRTNKTRQLSYVCCTYWTLNGVLVEVFYPLLLLSWLPFLYFDLPSPLYILDNSPLSDIWFANIELAKKACSGFSSLSSRKTFQPIQYFIPLFGISLHFPDSLPDAQKPSFCK